LSASLVVNKLPITLNAGMYFAISLLPI
jgi:hypothetical protein